MTLLRHLGLTVHNFGPIAKAEIELRPMTVFVGPSNTGKSYLAILVYALHRAFYASIGQVLRFARFPLDFQQVLFSGSRFASNPQYSKYTSDEVQEALASMKEWGRILGSTEKAVRSPVPEPIASLVRPLMSFDKDFFVYLEREIARCFGSADFKDLKRHSSRDKVRVSMYRNVPDQVESISYQLMPTGKGTSFLASVSDQSQLWIEEKGIQELSRELENAIQFVEDEDFSQEVLHSFLQYLKRSIAEVLLSPLPQKAFYLPSDRAGVMHSHRSVVSAIVRGAHLTGLEKKESLPSLSGVLVDFLAQLLEIEDLPEGARRNKTEQLAASLEKEVLGGTVHVEETDVRYPQFSYRPWGWKRDLPLLNTSSMVSELAPIVLYLRHYLRPGDVLIIEEPESHLHPEMQVELTRLLAAMVNSGIRVMLTTHSEWVLEELANLVRSSELPLQSRGSIPGAKMALKPEMVGAWLFEPKQRPKGTVVKEIPLDTDIGSFPSGFNLITEDIYNRWEEINSQVSNASGT